MSSSPSFSKETISKKDNIIKDQFNNHQRERARKISHSAIERRRRERMNDKISRLKELIPSCVEQENIHKMTVLQSAIDYIIHLKEIVIKSGHEEELLLLHHSSSQCKRLISSKSKETNHFKNQCSIDERSKEDLRCINEIQTEERISHIPLTPPEENNSMTDDMKHMSLQNILC
ncbi:Myc-type, basic helix-loop-helix domain-containing protein [Cokeromyces recurvatus]|uniref:Myc-type, basic helix-loop-helix domain-containing protein n=1 Tax=Cokeromyces recurvatus TaxID=90255 RepID=UPI00221E4DEA|nr:Myc-type, basic helix-loop-helix domain-containing protein [Cokeromyces recurvatus]KAI7902445.1 Myc-type, basic helix-loop-helix domain-containing protein [Cokeromyces recurvatus]